jgi:hypothetical protein
MNNDIYVYSLVTGQIYRTIKDDLKLLFPYQIPLASLPKNNCKKCFGRGYESLDGRTGLHNPCKCLDKHILPEFDTSKVKVYLPRGI